MSVSQSPAGVSVALEATDELLGIPRQDREASDATIEALDFEPDTACEYSMHWLVPGDPEAEWILVIADPPCGCIEGGVIAMCDPCKVRRTESGEYRCRSCDATHTASGVVRVERVR